jgi:hypothetical protein
MAGTVSIRLAATGPQAGEIDLQSELPMPKTLGILKLAEALLVTSSPVYDRALEEGQEAGEVYVAIEYPSELPNAQEIRVASVNGRADVLGLVECAKIVLVGKMFSPQSRQVLTPEEAKAAARARMGRRG